jgi:hypothetical protein
MTNFGARRTTSPTRSSAYLERSPISVSYTLPISSARPARRGHATRCLSLGRFIYATSCSFCVVGGARPSDITAEDYVADWCGALSNNPGRRAAREMGLVKDPDEEGLVWRVNKEIVHLTYDRLNISLEDRLWPVGAVSQHLGRDLQVFVEQVAPELVERSFFDRVDAALATFTFSLPNEP